ncbi:hypothetical protein F25303_11758 [Fusarium sp. NRRL 25303]|nr:hypothetical protein F25303_11758 [Fusarium sp. NRRL 25303]
MGGRKKSTESRVLKTATIRPPKLAGCRFVKTPPHQHTSTWHQERKRGIGTYQPQARNIKSLDERATWHLDLAGHKKGVAEHGTKSTENRRVSRKSGAEDGFDHEAGRIKTVLAQKG